MSLLIASTFTGRQSLETAVINGRITRAQFQSPLEAVRFIQDNHLDNCPWLEEWICTCPKAAFQYLLITNADLPECHDLVQTIPQQMVAFRIQKRLPFFPEHIKQIQTCPKATLDYICHVKKPGRPEDEAVLQTDLESWLQYLVNFSKRIPDDLINSILNNPDAFLIYIKTFTTPRPDLEPFIFSNPKLAWHYIQKVYNKPCPQAEALLAQSSYAYRYSKYILKKPWPEAEPYIHKHPASCFLYHLTWKRLQTETEALIKQYPLLWVRAVGKCLHNIIEKEANLHPYKDIIAKHPGASLKAALTIGRLPNAEPIIQLYPALVYQYCKAVLNKTWPEAEPSLFQSPECAVRYCVTFQKPAVNSNDLRCKPHAYICYSKAFKVRDVHCEACAKKHEPVLYYNDYIHMHKLTLDKDEIQALATYGIPASVFLYLSRLKTADPLLMSVLTKDVKMAFQYLKFFNDPPPSNIMQYYSRFSLDRWYRHWRYHLNKRRWPDYENKLLKTKDANKKVYIKEYVTNCLTNDSDKFNNELYRYYFIMSV